MIAAEFDTIFEEYLGSWKYTDGQVKVLRTQLLKLSEARFRRGCERLLSTHEERTKPSVASILRIVQDTPSTDTSSYLRPGGRWLTDAERKLFAEYLKRYCVRDMAKRADAIRWYLQQCTEHAYPLSDSLLEWFGEELERCKAAAAVHEPVKPKPPERGEPVQIADVVDEVEAMLGPDILAQQAAAAQGEAWDNPFT